uniref:Uncharacterized protein n=1 Tax=Babesia bovis TaxID=5865 RepID=S6B3M2_BABBO|nr:hypothetical protein BEWA_005210 [Babesia bovis]
MSDILRQFMNLFITLSHQFTQDGKSVKFGRVDCSGSLMGDNLCHRYNVGVVPSVAYVSQFIIQREHLSTQGTVSRALRWSLSKSIDDIKSLHSTCYKGDLFIYQELYDWASILYSIGRIRRLFDKMSLDNMLQRLLGYFRH